jgi:polysaccharide deacetylase 2 family uncharacterized protein YibQ
VKKKSKQNQKKKNRKNRLLKSVKIFFVCLLIFATYLLYQVSKGRDLNAISIKLDNSVGKILLARGVSQINIIERFQTEEQKGKSKWVKFTKKIKTTGKEYRTILQDIEKITEELSLVILSLSETKKYATLEIGLSDKTLNKITFQFKTKDNLLAIIVDDLGYSKNIKSFIELDVPITYAILPGLPYSEMLAKEFMRSEIPYILHMPMEPEGYPKTNPGKIALLTDMGNSKVHQTLKRALDNVYGAQGLNNHMGSRFTADPNSMKNMLKFLKREGLFYVDSRKTGKTVGYGLAKKLGVQTIINNFYIDNKDDAEYLNKRMKALKSMALKRKKTVAICHITRKNTAKALKSYIPEFKSAGIEFVEIRELLE